MASLAQRSGPLGRRLAAHLLRRTTLGVSKQEIEAFALKTADAAVDDLLNFPAIPPPPKDPQTGQTWMGGRTSSNSSDFLLFKYLAGWWVHEAFSTTSMVQQLMLFLHQNFTCDVSVHSVFVYNQLRLFRHYAKGSYKDLSKKICMDSGMLLFLDNGRSTKQNPNENFPREFLELFTIGKGPQIAPGHYTHYTEDDVREASRLFTGIKFDYSYTHIDADTSLPTGYIDVGQHDQLSKTFSSCFSNQTIAGRNTVSGIKAELSDLADMVFSKIETARNISRKLYRWFVHSEITAEIEQDVIGPMATALMANNYQLEVVLKLLLKSRHFYDEDDMVSTDEIVGGIVKSPLELYAGALKFFQITLPDPQASLYDFYYEFYYQDFIEYLCDWSGMDLFNPPSVAGYPAYHQAPAYDDLWINSSTLAFRYLFADMLLAGNRLLAGGALDVQLNVMEFITHPDIIPVYQGPDPLGNPGPHTGCRIAEHLVRELLDYLFPEPVSATRFKYYLEDLLLGNLSAVNWMDEWDYFTRTKNDSHVRPQLEKLIRGIIQSPEFHLK